MPSARYTYRIRPGKRALNRLCLEANLARWTWNQCVGTDRDKRANDERLSGYDMKRELTKWRRDNPWLAEGSAVVQQEAVLDWGRARQASFTVKGRRPPRFRSKYRWHPSLSYLRTAFRLRENRLCLAGGISIPVVWSRELPSEPSSVRVYRDAVGHWWASFVVKVEDDVVEADGSLGIDWGVKAVATTTDEAYDLPHHKHARTGQAKLTKYQRMMARRKPKPGQPSSKGYKAAKRQTAKQHRHVRWQREDAAKKWAKRVVDNHDQIAVENFKPRFMAKNRKLARTAADAGVGIAKRELLQRAERAGRTVVLVPPAYTTMTCGECGARTKRLTLAERTFRCECGHVADRDQNAARVILAAAGFNGACAEDVRPEPFEATAV